MGQFKGHTKAAASRVCRAKVEGAGHVKSLRYLRDTEASYKGISVAHDMSPWQREEIKKLVHQAKQEHGSNCNEPVENFWFRVVGKGAKMRVMKVRKKEQSAQSAQ